MRRLFCVFAVLAILGGGLEGYAANELSEYKNKENGFSIQFPSSWKIKEGAGGAAVQALGPKQGKAADAFLPYISVSVEAVPQTMTLDEYASRGIEKARSVMPDFKVHRLGRQTISHTRAKWWIITSRAGTENVKGLLFMVVKGNRAYRIICASALAQYSSYKDLFVKSVGTLVIESGDVQSPVAPAEGAH